MPEQDRIAEILAKYTTSPELELQQRAVEFASLFTLGETRIGVLEQMPPPELKATVMGVGELILFLVFLRRFCSMFFFVSLTILKLARTSLWVPRKAKKCVSGPRSSIPMLIFLESKADLLGDEVLSTPTVTSAPQPTASAQSNQDLLAEIFGSSSATSTTSSPPPQQQRSTVDDIMGLFGTTSTPGVQTPHPNAKPPSYPFAPASSFPPTAAPQTVSPPQPTTTTAPPQQRLTAYPAYEKNDLKITLTPQTSAAKPGVVMILARFQVSGGEAAMGLSFQAAVPKVNKSISIFFVQKKSC